MLTMQSAHPLPEQVSAHAKRGITRRMASVLSARTSGRAVTKGSASTRPRARPRSEVNVAVKLGTIRTVACVREVSCACVYMSL